jgi:hypothetical protein
MVTGFRQSFCGSLAPGIWKAGGPQEIDSAVLTRCNIVTFWLPDYDDLSFYFLNVADFKGIRAG